MTNEFTDKLEAQVEMEETLYPALTFGVQFGEENVTGTGDAVIPLVNYRDGLLFLNPRVSGDDQDAEEFNLGLGVRQIISEKGVLGANAYWDSRDTASGNHFNQFGFGLEWLTKFWDARLVRSGHIGNILSWDIGNSKNGNYAMEKCYRYARKTSICHTGAEWSFYDQRTLL